MVERGFIYCPACEEVGRERRLAPGFSPCLEEGADGAPVSEPDFVSRHAGHGLRRLAVAHDGYVSEAAYGATARLAFHSAVDRDGSRWIIELRREAAGRPVRYRLRRGQLLRTRRTIGVDPLAIAHAVADSAGRPIDAALVRAAGSLAEVAAAAAAAAGFDSLEAQAVAGPTPLVAHAPLPDAALPRLFDAGRRLLSDAAPGSLAGRGRALSPRRFATLLELHAAPGGAFAPILEAGYTLIGRTGAVEGYLRRVRTREPLPAVR